MKRPIACIVAIAMILSLAACGGKSSKQSSQTTSPDTPQVTQGNSTPQPSEPSTPSVVEPPKTAGNIPEGAIPLYDGRHYLQLTKRDEGEYYVEYANNIGDNAYTLVSGNIIPKDTIEITYDKNDKSTSVIFGDTTTFAEQEGMPQTVFEIYPSKGIMDENDYGIKMKFTYDTQETATTKIYGQIIRTRDDLISLLGEPTAAFGNGWLAYVNGGFEDGGDAQGKIRYLWQFNDFVLISGSESFGYSGPEKGLDTTPDGCEAYCIKISDFKNAIESGTQTDVLLIDGLNIITMLSNLGLI